MEVIKKNDFYLLKRSPDSNTAERNFQPLI